MQLNLRTDYALRMLMALAAKDEVVSIDWIADQYGISRNHLAKVAQELAAAGFVETQRGRGGGLQLARPPAQ
ncbi:MAG: Rrf2 family transcriptional regulator, partial [Parvularcula sp.]|nr:Rrf2 family transcriptional regulator [Parvularcula sp.]